MNLRSNDKDSKKPRFALGSKLHVIACIVLLLWTLFICTFLFTPRSEYADSQSRIYQVAHALTDVARKVPGCGSEGSIHAVYFAVLTLLVGACLLTSSQSSYRVVLLAVGLVMGFAFLSELLQQYLVPGRSAEIRDLTADAAGIGAGGLLLRVGIITRRVYIVRV